MARPDRVFPDANVLFAAAWRPDSGLLRLWRVPRAELVTSAFALAEARANTGDPEALRRLDGLAAALRIVPESTAPLPREAAGLPGKDVPILAAALASGATHLLTGDRRHFGRFYGRRLGGLLVEPPADYLRGSGSRDGGSPPS